MYAKERAYFHDFNGHFFYHEAVIDVEQPILIEEKDKAIAHVKRKALGLENLTSDSFKDAN